MVTSGGVSVAFLATALTPITDLYFKPTSFVYLMTTERDTLSSSEMERLAAAGVAEELHALNYSLLDRRSVRALTCCLSPLHSRFDAIAD